MGFDQIRMEQMRQWLSRALADVSWPPKRLAGDASFRSYYRIQANDKSYVVMDAPPEKERCEAFVAIDRSFYQMGLRVPEIYASDMEKGFLLLSDFGDRLYLDSLNSNTASSLYAVAVENLLTLQTCREIADYTLPTFDEALYQHEFDLFHDWFLATEKKYKLTETDTQILSRHYHDLCEAIKQQPQVCVHRDYHSRNLMVLPNNGVGILDFQDAVWGPITYDILSLYRDCYIDWPEEWVQRWVAEYHQQLLDRKMIQEKSTELFEKWFDFTSAQRHMKCVGIFSRLTHLYDKPSYHQYLPRTEQYLKHVCQKHRELQCFLPYLEEA